MITDFRTLEDSVRLEADICIVGAGAAGISLAREFADSSLHVLLVESGGMEQDAAAQQLCSGENAGLRHEGLMLGRYRGFGGTTRLWSGQCIPLEELDFEPRSWVPHSGWPIRRGDLDPYYRRALPLFQLDRDAQFDESLWTYFGLKAPELNPNYVVPRFTIYSPQPDLGKAYRRFLGKSANVRVLLHANVVDLRTGDSQRRIETLEIRSLAGKRAAIRARAVILCCGGIENPRLLLCCNRQERAGLGNRNDLVGRFFQDHPKCLAASVRPSSARHMQNLYSLFYRRGTKYFPKLALSARRQRSAGVLSCVSDLVYEFDAVSTVGIAKRVYGAWRKERRLGVPPKDFLRLMTLPHQTGSILLRRLIRGRSAIGDPVSVRLQIHAEQAPDPLSRVTLSEEKDQLGLPRARVDWRLGEPELRAIRLLTLDVAAEFDRLGIGSIQPEAWLDGDASGSWTDHIEDSYHHIGTTRMSDSPASGVVDANCEVHGCAGLFMAGSSVFPTSSYANPTLTIVALAIRLADHLKTVLRTS